MPRAAFFDEYKDGDAKRLQQLRAHIFPTKGFEYGEGWIQSCAMNWKAAVKLSNTVTPY